MQIIDRIKERFQPLGITARVLAAQFFHVNAAKMRISRIQRSMQISFVGTPTAEMKIEGARLADLHILIERGEVVLCNIKSGAQTKMNKRESRFLGSAIHNWLSMDGVELQVEVIA